MDDFVLIEERPDDPTHSKEENMEVDEQENQPIVGTSSNANAVADNPTIDDPSETVNASDDPLADDTNEAVRVNENLTDAQIDALLDDDNAVELQDPVNNVKGNDAILTENQTSEPQADMPEMTQNKESGQETSEDSTSPPVIKTETDDQLLESMLHHQSSRLLDSKIEAMDNQQDDNGDRPSSAPSDPLGDDPQNSPAVDDTSRSELRTINAGLSQICKLFSHLKLKEECISLKCASEKREMLNFLAKLVEGIEFILNGMQDFLPKMRQIAKIGQNTSKVFNLGVNFEDNLILNLAGLENLEKLINITRRKFLNEGADNDPATKRARTGSNNAQNAYQNGDIGVPLAHSTPLHDPSPSSSEDQYLNSKFLRLSNVNPEMLNDKKAQKPSSQEVIELSDDEDTTLTISPMPAQPRPVSSMRPGPSRSPVKAAFSQIATNPGMKRPNGYIPNGIVRPNGNMAHPQHPQHPVAIVPPFKPVHSGASSPLLGPRSAPPRSITPRLPSPASHGYPNSYAPRNPTALRPAYNGLQPTLQRQSDPLPRPTIDMPTEPSIKCQLFQSLCTRQYFAERILPTTVSNNHPKKLPLANNLDTMAPNLRIITTKINRENGHIVVHLYVEFEFKFNGQKLFLFYYLKSQADNPRATTSNAWSDGGSHACNRNGATVIKMKFQDVRPDEMLFVSLRLGSDAHKGPHSIPLAINLGQPMASIAVQFNENHQVVIPEVNTQPEVVDLD